MNKYLFPFPLTHVEDQRRTFLKSLKGLLSAVFLAIGYSKDIRERHYAIIQKIIIDDVFVTQSDNIIADTNFFYKNITKQKIVFPLKH